MAATTATRSEALPDIPTIGELLLGFEASQWVGLDAPRKMWFADLGSTVLPGGPAGFAKVIADDTEKWGKVIKLSGAKAG